MLAPLVAACGGGGGGSAARETPREAVALNAANPNYDQPGAVGAVMVTGHAGANTIVTGRGSDIIQAGAGADLINAGPGGDTIEAGADDDIIVVVGRNARGDATYRAYTLSDLTNPRGSGIDVSGLVRLSDLNDRPGDDGDGDRQIDGGGGTGDTLVVFGRTDLSRVSLQGIERIVIGSDLSLAPSQLDSVTQIVADDGAVLRLVGSGTVDLNAVRFMRIDLVSGVITESLDLNGVRHIETGAGVTLVVPDSAALAGVQVLSGAGQVRVEADDDTAFAGIRLMEGLRVAVNAGATDPGAVRGQTVGSATAFGGAPVPAGMVLPSGGLLFDGAAAAADTFAGTGNADRFELGAGDTATGGGGGDLFVLPATGTATVADFEAGDRLRLEGVSAEQVASATVASGGVLTVTMQDGSARTVTLTGAAPGNLRMQSAGTGVELFLNQAPEAPSLQTLRVAEDAAAGAMVGRTDAADPDGDALTYSLSAGNADNAFAIDSASGQITVAGPLDHETGASRTLTVSISDGSATTTTTVTVTITDVNEAQGAPQLDGGTTGTVAENDAGAVIGAVTVSDPDDATEPFGMHRFAVSDARFEVDSQGRLKLRDGMSLDHEAAATVTVTVTATDQAPSPLPATSSAFTITVTDVNEPPQAAGDRAFTVAEGASYVLRASDLSATDPDAGDGATQLTWTLTVAPATGSLQRNAGTSSVPNWQDLAAGNTFTQSELEAGSVRYTHDGSETRTGISFSVRVADDGTPALMAAPSSFTVTVMPVNDAPVLSAVSFSVAPNAANGAAVGTLAATDADLPADTLSYAIVVGGTAPTGLFAIDRASGAITVADNSRLGAGGATHTLAVEVSDGAGGTVTATVTVRVGGAALPGGATVAESATADQSFDLSFPGLSNGRITAATTATTGVTVTRVDDDTIRIMGALDHETLPGGVLPIMVSVAADSGISFTQTLSLPVTDVNEAPSSSGDRAFTVGEGASYTLTTADLSATDEDAGDGAAQLTWRVTMAPTNGRLALRSALDTAVTSFTQAQLAAGQVVYVHDDTDTTSDSFVVQVEDDAGTPLTAAADTVTVTVTVVDDAPTAVALTGTTTSLAEDTDTTSAVKVADIGVTDSDGGPRGLVLAGADMNLFELNAAQTELRLRAGTVLDFEGGDTQLDVTVRVGATGPSEDLRITVTNVDEAPGATSLSGLGTVARTASAGTDIGTLSATDPDAGDAAPTFTLRAVKGQDGSTDVTMHPFAITNGLLEISASATTQQLMALTMNSRFTLTVRAQDASDANLYEDTDIVLSVLVRTEGTTSGETLTGGTGAQAGQADELVGLAGNDILNGGGGPDILDGGEDDDTLTGGAGADVFVYRFDSRNGGLPSTWTGVDGLDRILDYAPSQGDKIRFIDQNAGANRIDTLAEFKAALDLSQNPNLALPLVDRDTSQDFVLVALGRSLPRAEGQVSSGNHRLNVYTAIDQTLYDADTGQFNDVDAFIEALGGADALLFG